MLHIIQRLIPLPDGASGLILEDGVLRVAGGESHTAAYLDEVRARWSDIVREAARQRVTANAIARLRALRTERDDAAEAEALGVPPPGGRSVAELDQLISEIQAVFRSVHDAINAAASVAEINAALQGALDDGHAWLVGEDWEPYPEECPWSEMPS